MSTSSGNGRLTTHVLDTMAGKPASGVRVVLRRLAADRAEDIAETATNPDGRCDRPLLEGKGMATGRYELVFFVGDYFRAEGVDLPDPAFLDVVPIRFGLWDAGSHYHVPLLISPYGYSTYRGG